MNNRIIRFTKKDNKVMFDRLSFVTKAGSTKKSEIAYMSAMNQLNVSQGISEQHKDKLFISMTDNKRLHITWIYDSEKDELLPGIIVDEKVTYEITKTTSSLIELQMMPIESVYPDWRKLVSEDDIVGIRQDDSPWKVLVNTCIHNNYYGRFNSAYRLEQMQFSFAKLDICIQNKYLEPLIPLINEPEHENRTIIMDKKKSSKGSGYQGSTLFFVFPYFRAAAIIMPLQTPVNIFEDEEEQEKEE